MSELIWYLYYFHINSSCHKNTGVFMIRQVQQVTVTCQLCFSSVGSTKKLNCLLRDVKTNRSSIRHLWVQQVQSSWFVNISSSASLCISGPLWKRLDKVKPSDYSRITLKFPLQSHFGTILLLSFLLSLYHTDTLLTQPSTTSPVARGNKMTLPPQVCRMVLDFLREPTGSYYNVNSAGYEE